MSRAPVGARPTTVNPLDLRPVISCFLATSQGSQRSARHAAAAEARHGPALGCITPSARRRAVLPVDTVAGPVRRGPARSLKLRTAARVTSGSGDRRARPAATRSGCSVAAPDVVVLLCPCPSCSLSVPPLRLRRSGVGRTTFDYSSQVGGLAVCCAGSAGEGLLPRGRRGMPGRHSHRRPRTHSSRTVEMPDTTTWQCGLAAP